MTEVQLWAGYSARRGFTSWLDPSPGVEDVGFPDIWPWERWDARELSRIGRQGPPNPRHCHSPVVPPLNHGSWLKENQGKEWK